MSYKMPNSGNSMNDFFRRQVDFINMAPNLINAKTLDEFKVWYEKLVAVDKRSLYLYLCKNKNNIKLKYIEYAQKRLKLPIV